MVSSFPPNLPAIVSHTDGCRCFDFHDWFISVPEDREDSFHEHHSPAPGSWRWLLWQQTRLAHHDCHHDCLWTSLLHTDLETWTAKLPKLPKLKDPQPCWLRGRNQFGYSRDIRVLRSANALSVWGGFPFRTVQIMVILYKGLSAAQALQMGTCRILQASLLGSI